MPWKQCQELKHYSKGNLHVPYYTQSRAFIFTLDSSRPTSHSLIVHKTAQSSVYSHQQKLLFLSFVLKLIFSHMPGRHKYDTNEISVPHFQRLTFCLIKIWVKMTHCGFDWLSINIFFFTSIPVSADVSTSWRAAAEEWRHEAGTV